MAGDEMFTTIAGIISAAVAGTVKAATGAAAGTKQAHAVGAARAEARQMHEEELERGAAGEQAAKIGERYKRGIAEEQRAMQRASVRQQRTENLSQMKKEERDEWATKLLNRANIDTAFKKLLFNMWGT